MERLTKNEIKQKIKDLIEPKLSETELKEYHDLQLSKWFEEYSERGFIKNDILNYVANLCVNHIPNYNSQLNLKIHGEIQSLLDKIK